LCDSKIRACFLADVAYSVYCCIADEDIMGCRWTNPGRRDYSILNSALSHTSKSPFILQKNAANESIDHYPEKRSNETKTAGMAGWKLSANSLKKRLNTLSITPFLRIAGAHSKLPTSEERKASFMCQYPWI